MAQPECVSMSECMPPNLRQHRDIHYRGDCQSICLWCKQFPITQLSFSPASASSASEWELSPGEVKCEQKNFSTFCLSICSSSPRQPKCLQMSAQLRSVDAISSPRGTSLSSRRVPINAFYILVPAVVALKAF